MEAISAGRGSVMLRSETGKGVTVECLHRVLRHPHDPRSVRTCRTRYGRRHPVVVIGAKTYDRCGSNLTVKADGMLVLTDTGTSKNSEDFDGSGFQPNSNNGGNTASRLNSGANPTVKITIAGTMTTYLDNGQVLHGPPRLARAHGSGARPRATPSRGRGSPRGP